MQSRSRIRKNSGFVARRASELSRVSAPPLIFRKGLTDLGWWWNKVRLERRSGRSLLVRAFPGQLVGFGGECRKRSHRCQGVPGEVLWPPCHPRPGGGTVNLRTDRPGTAWASESSQG